MVLLRRLFILVIFIVAVLAIFMPPLIGIGIQKWVNIETFFPGLQNKADIQVTEYKRGWFTSDVTVVMNITDPGLRSALIDMGIEPTEIPQPVQLVLTQHLQHGPIFYSWHKGMKCRFGLAAMERKLEIPQKEQKFFTSLNISNASLKNDQTFIGLSGKIYTHIELVNYNMFFPKAGVQAVIGSLQTNIWQWLFQDRIKGEVIFDDIYLNGGISSLLLPKASVQFDLKKEKNGLWIGSHTLSLPEIMVREEGNNALEVNDLQTNGSVGESTGLLSGQKEFVFKKLQYKDQAIGPFHLQVSAERINAEAIAKLIDTYQDIKLHGEMYGSQLRQRIFSILPSVVTQGASIQIDKLDVATANGQMQMQAKLAWPKDNFIAPDSMEDLIQTSKLQASLRISVPLTDEIIGLISKMTYLYQLPMAERAALVDMNNAVQLGTQQNTYAIMDLTQLNQLPKEDALQLIMMVRTNISYDDYAMRLRELLFTRKINRETSYLLGWLYSDLTSKEDLLNQNLHRYEQDAEQQIHAELNQFIKLGYVTLDKNDYVLLLVRENGLVKVNGKALH